MTVFGAVFEDLVPVYVGPFQTQAEVDEHRAFCQERGDGGDYLGNVGAPPIGALVMTPERDREYERGDPQARPAT